MRKVLPGLLIGLGAFLVAAAIVCLTWVPGQVERTPLGTDNTTALSGTASVLGDPEGPVLAWSENKVDSDVSDDKNVVFNTSLCVVHDDGNIDGCVKGDDKRLINAETAQFVADRHTAETVKNGDYLPADAPQMEGLQNKWPFDAQKKTYPVWDGIVGAAVDADYVGEDSIDGLKVYKYEYTANVGPVNLVGDINGTYFATYDFYIEPKTGSIINQEVHDQRIASGVETILDLKLAFTDDQVQSNVDDANDAIATLNLLEKTIPIVGLAVGIPVLLIGIVLLVLGRRRGKAAPPAAAESKEPANV
ncbi:DUF3068 domain-containing protein [Nocardioides mangrovi]|uniref:DUF3068 domain-containing protein n=1 Tax=Nocardioides mangrovi TaxID=2874580 RepID=A0ABS7UEX1_9ACTN|nr:DUF3068 domain-containing protein [Nocardioides mangrovi]MBZ5739417.1 DUF3068 domain-containing protein [Nocardioides mangrovi]